MTRGGVGRVTNAVLAWALAAVVAGIGWLAADRVGPLWAALAGVVAVVAVVPALRYRRLTAVPPWPLLVVAGGPIAVRTVVVGDLAAVGGATGTPVPGLPAVSESTLATLGTFADAAALAAIALLVVAVVQGFSDLRLTTRFGMLFVAVATTGLGGFWAVGRWASERYLDGGAFVATNEALMHEFAAITAAGVVVALVFGPYFCRARPRPAAGAGGGDRGGDDR